MTRKQKGTVDKQDHKIVDDFSSTATSSSSSLIQLWQSDYGNSDRRIMLLQSL
jgi:hypothetical protein